MLLRSTFALAIVSLLFGFQGCTKLQRAVGCGDPGIFGCRDEPLPPVDAEAEMRRAPEVATGRFPSAARNQSDQPWVPLINSCMANGGQRTQCIENLPPDVLAQLEAWEAENAEMRRRQLEQRIRGL